MYTAIVIPSLYVPLLCGSTGGQRKDEVSETNSGRGNKEELLRKPMSQQIQSELAAQVGDQWIKMLKLKMDCHCHAAGTYALPFCRREPLTKCAGLI